MDINQFYSIIGINKYENKIIKYLIFINLIFILGIFIPVFYSFYSFIFINTTIYEFVKILIGLQDLISLYILHKSKVQNYIINYFDQDITQTTRNYYNLSLLYGTIISLLLSIIFTILAYYNRNIDIITDSINNKNHINCFITFFYIFYSSQIKYFVLINFLFIFYTITIYLKDYTDDLNDTEYNISIICQQFLEIRHKYNITIEQFNSLFSTFIIFNFIIAYFSIYLIYDGNYELSLIRSLIYFVVSTSIFHLILHRIGESIKNLKITIDNNRFIRMFLDRNQIHEINYDFENINEIPINQLCMRNHMIEVENGNSIDWIIINYTINQEWNTFDILSFDWSNYSIIFRFISFIIILWIGNHVSFE